MPKPNPKVPNKRLSRHEQRARHQERRVLDPQAVRKALLAEETGTIIKQGAQTRIALCYPNPYRVAMSSLGYQVIYRMMNERPYASAERVVLPDEPDRWRQRRWAPVSIESGTPIGDFDLLAFSVAYDLDIPGFFELLELGGVPVHREERGAHHPPIILGGPLTASNVLPFGPFIDAAVVGDGEVAVAAMLDALDLSSDRDDFLCRVSNIPGVWVPELHGDRVPATQKVTVGALPAVGQIITPNTELSNMFLLEASRGCPRFCKFCLVRSPESPMREPNLEEVLAHIPDHAPRVGFVGAAVSEWRGIRDALKHVVELGKGVGVSSLRADRLDEEFVDLLSRGGYRTLTVASDAASQRLRGKMAKGLRTRDLIRSAQLAQFAGFRKLKLYVVIGLPGETEEDIDELIALTEELSAMVPVALGLSPLVPKLHTPLGDAEFYGIRPLERRLKRLKKTLGGVAEVRSTSARWAWVEYRLSQGGQDAGLAAYEAWRAGGRFADYKRALEGTEERLALHAAARHNLWRPAGMK